MTSRSKPSASIFKQIDRVEAIARDETVERLHLDLLRAAQLVRGRALQRIGDGELGQIDGGAAGLWAEREPPAIDVEIGGASLQLVEGGGRPARG